MVRGSGYPYSLFPIPFSPVSPPNHNAPSRYGFPQLIFPSGQGP